MNNPDSFIDEIETTINDAKVYSLKDNSYPYMPEIIEYLELFQEILRTGKRHAQFDSESRKRLLSGFGKLVLDNVDFYESEMGRRILDVGNEFLETGI